jgi:hypothetical protein
MNANKTCSKCKIEKTIENFYFRKDRNKYTACCKSCSYNKVYQKNYRVKNKIKIKDYHRERYEIKKDKILEKTREYRLKNKKYYSSYNKKWYLSNKTRHNKQTKKYYESNKHIIFLKQKERLKTDVMFKIKKNLQRRLHHALKGTNKSARTLELIGCDLYTLKNHLQKLFKNGMEWSNYGCNKGCWSIDHIIPMSHFNLKSKEEQAKCCHYTNLQPMWHIENIKKSNKLLV